MKITDKQKFANMIGDLIDNKQELYAFLSKIYINNEAYDEVLSGFVSRTLVQQLVDRFDEQNGDYYKDLLVDIHNDFGYHNGGCILFDYYTIKKRDVKKLMSDDRIVQLYKQNQEDVLSQGDEFLPRSIYRLNLCDESFVQKLIQRYPKMFNAGSLVIGSSQQEV